MKSLEDTINYHFHQPDLLVEALTHPSLASETNQNRSSNQRLEYLGDAVIQLILTDELFHRYPNEDEGFMTKKRSRIVSRESLGKFAMNISLGTHLLMSKGERSHGGETRLSTLSDAFEALSAAIYLDGGLEATKRFLMDNFGEAINVILAQPEEPNSKGQLQEALQAIAPVSPTYHIVYQEGPDHNKSFVAEVRWQGRILGVGSGGSKKLAEIEAAATALKECRWIFEKSKKKSS